MAMKKPEDLTFEELAALPEDHGILVDSIENGVRYIIVRGPSSLCAYVGVPRDHPLGGFGYDSIPLSCHGGLTFAGSGDVLRGGKGPWPKGWYWYGWDYSHSEVSFNHPKVRAPQAEKRKWTVKDVLGEIWSVTYDFQKLMRLAEKISSRQRGGGR